MSGPGQSGDEGNPPLPESRWELAVLSGSQAGTVFALPTDGGVIGASEGSSVRLLDATVAPGHARVETREDGSLWLVSLMPHGATRLNGDPIQESPLFDGAELELGQVHLRVRQKSLRDVLDTAHPANPSRVSGTTSAEDLADDNPLTPGDTLGERYRILEKIGEGGMGNVYRAEHRVLHKPFAVKVLRHSMSSNAAFVRRFEREAVSASQIRHSNIVDVVDFGRTPEGQLYFVMEYLAGESLQKVIAREGALPAVRALGIAAQISRALAAAHDRGILHRDIKPDNVVLMEKDGFRDFVKVVDFGIARVADAIKDSLQTQAGTIMGTPQYMSPEQAAGLEHDARSDIYSLGVMLFEMVAGHPPFVGPTPTHVLAAHIMKPAPPLPETTQRGIVPPTLIALVRRMLAKSADERPQSMREVSEALDVSTAELGETPLPSPSLTPRPPVTWPPRGILTVPDRATGERPSLSVPALPLTPARTTAVLGLGLVALVAVGAIGWVLALKMTKPRAAPRPAPTVLVKEAPAPLPAVPQRIQVRITSQPGGVRVSDERGFLGRTPMSLSLEPGRAAHLRFQAPGFLPQEREVLAHEDTGLAVTLTPRAGHGRKPGTDADDLKDSPY